MWCWIIISLLVYLNTTLSVPTIQNDFTQPRECCPCPSTPPATIASPNEGAITRSRIDDCPCRFRSDQDRDHDTMADTSGGGAFIPSGGMDDCPCQFRDADSMGAPSLLFPSAVRALWPGVSEKDSKEDLKPLLHPEVGLASSVLETLRQATDEEYEDALARDAMKSIMRATEDDLIENVNSVLNPAKHVVNVILRPDTSKEDQDAVIAEASHVQESRCVPPPGKSSTIRSDLSKSDKLFDNLFDMDSDIGASNVHESVVESSGRLENFKSQPTLFNLLSNSKSKLNFNEGFPLRNSNLKTIKNQKDIDVKVGGISENPLKTLNERINSTLSDIRLKLGNQFEMKKPDSLLKPKTVTDNNSAPSVKNEQFFGITRNNKPKIDIKSVKPDIHLKFTTMKPFPLKNLLNLKDVELIPPVKVNSNYKTKIKIPQLVPSHDISDDKMRTGIFKDSKIPDLSELIQSGLKPNFKNRPKITNIQLIPKESVSTSDINDAVSSPSEMKINTVNSEQNNENCNGKNDEDIPNIKSLTNSKKTNVIEKLPTDFKLKPKKEFENDINKEFESDELVDVPNDLNKEVTNTEILDTIPNPSENQDTDILNPNEFDEESLFKGPTQNADRFEDGVSSFEEAESIESHNNAEEDNVNIADDGENSDEIDNESSSDTNFENVNSEMDSETEPSNNVLNIVSSEKNNMDIVSSESTESIIPCSNENVAENNNKNFFNFNPIFKKPENLPSLKETILNTLDKLSLNKKNTKSLENDVISDNFHSDTRSVDECEDNNFTTPLNEETNSSNQVTLQDLQNMSDKLLDLSSRKDQQMFSSEAEDCSPEDSGTELEYNGFPTSTEINIIYEKNNDDIESEILPLETSIVKNNLPDTSNTKENVDVLQNNAKDQKSCLVELQNSSDKENINDLNEMTVDASDHVINTLVPSNSLSSPLLFGRSNFKLGDILSVNLLGMNERKSDLPNIFERSHYSAEDRSIIEEEDVNSSEVESVMTPAASAPSFESTIPSLRPLQDIDLDIFQLKPLLLPGPSELFSKVPRLNLNSYRAKLALPKSLKLKPMKLRSSLGGKNGLFGATLTIDPNKLNIPKQPNLLQNSLNNLPTFEELRSVMRENAQNLLLTPLETTGRNAIEDTFRSGQTISDNLRSHAKSTMKNLQQTLETTLKDVKQNDLLGDSIKSPQEFLQAVSRTHEDLNDKLKGIQYDLNDRLESIRDRIVDQSILPSLSSPIMRENNIRYNPEDIFVSKNKPFLSTSNTKRLQNKPKSTNKINSKSNSRVSASRTKPSKAYKMPTAASVPVPTTVESPKLKTVAPTKMSPLKHSSLRTPQLHDNNKKSISDIFQRPVSHLRDSKIPVLGKFKPRENKVTISFTTTTKPDVIKPRNKPTLHSSKLNAKLVVPKKSNSLSNLGTSKKSSISGSKLKPIQDSSGSPSEITVSKSAPPNQEISPDSFKSRTHLWPKTSKINSDDKMISENKSASPIGKSLLLDSNNKRPLAPPRNTDILSSLREAVRARLANINPAQISLNNEIVQPDSVLDMSNAASENIETVKLADDLMKEKASYTCRMVCTRNKISDDNV